MSILFHGHDPVLVLSHLYYLGPLCTVGRIHISSLPSSPLYLILSLPSSPLFIFLSSAFFVLSISSFSPYIPTISLHKQTNTCRSIPRSQAVFIHFKMENYGNYEAFVEVHCGHFQLVGANCECLICQMGFL